MKASFFFPRFPSNCDCSAKPAMTLPSVVRDLLILAPSFNLAPVAPVLLALSLPAKSTKLLDEKKNQYKHKQTFTLYAFT